MNPLRLFLTIMICFAAVVHGQNGIVLQQGVDGYSGCTDVDALSETYGNNKHVFENKVENELLIVYYKC